MDCALTGVTLNRALLPALVIPMFLAAAPRPALDLAKMPLAFEPNRGQGDRVSQYLARGAGYTIGLRPGAAAIAVREKSGKSNVLQLRFAGASAASRPVAEQPLPGKVNYFIGSDRKRWQSDIPTFAAVTYPRIYPGVDLVYYGNQGNLEFDFRIQPGADPSAIRMVLSGPQHLHIDSDGDLLIAGMRQHKPVAYQETATGRKGIDCHYVLQSDGQVRIALGDYDHHNALVIDPVLSYSTFMGGSLGDAVAAVAVDSTGNLFMAGFTSSANLTTRGGTQNAYAGTNSALFELQFGDAFVAKLNPAGTALVYSTYLGGGGDDAATALAIDGSGNAYIAGFTQSSNFPTTSGAFQKTYKGVAGNDVNGYYDPGDGFLTKLNAAGNSLVYSTYLGGSLNDIALGVAVDSNGNAIVVGGTESTDFPTTANGLARQFQGNNNGSSPAAGDAFVTVVNPAGSALVFSTFLGGSGAEAGTGVAVDGQNNIYVCGITSSGNFPTTQGAFQTTFQNAGSRDASGNALHHGFVTKLSPQGSLVYSTLLGGESSDKPAGLALDSTGAVYITGATQSTKFPTTTGAAQSTYKGRGAAGSLGDVLFGDAFVTKLNPAGSAVVYSTYLGGSADDTGVGIAVDASGNAYVAGSTLSSNFPVTPDAIQASFAGFGGQGMAANPNQGFDSERIRNSGDAFFAKLSSTGALTFSTYFGGSQDDAAFSVAVDAAGNAYIGGDTLSTNLKTSSGALQSSYGGTGTQGPRGDGFVAKISFGGTLPGAAAKVTVLSGFSGTGAAGATLATPFTVQVVDAQGTPVPGVSVSFSATSATVNPATATTDAHGKASTTVTLGTTAGSGSVTATVANVPAASATLTINAAVTAPKVTAIVNDGGFGADVAPGALVAIFTDQPPTQSIFTSPLPWPLTLGGYRVLVNGTPIPIYAVAAVSTGGQIAAELPYETAVGPAQIVVELNGVQSAPLAFTVKTAAPGIFTFNGDRAVVQNVAPDGSVSVNTDTNPVPAGDYIIAYLTGQGPLDHPIGTNQAATADPISRVTLPYSALLGTTPIDIAFLGMTPGQVVLAQANIQIPHDTPPGTYTLVIKIGSASSNGPKITVTAPRQ